MVNNAISEGDCCSARGRLTPYTERSAGSPQQTHYWSQFAYSISRFSSYIRTPSGDFFFFFFFFFFFSSVCEQFKKADRSSKILPASLLTKKSHGVYFAVLSIRPGGLGSLVALWKYQIGDHAVRCSNIPSGKFHSLVLPALWHPFHDLLWDSDLV